MLNIFGDALLIAARLGQLPDDLGQPDRKGALREDRELDWLRASYSQRQKAR